MVAGFGELVDALDLGEQRRVLDLVFFLKPSQLLPVLDLELLHEGFVSVVEVGGRVHHVFVLLRNL